MSQAGWWVMVRPTVNALYAAGGQVQRLLPLFVIRGLQGDHFSSGLPGPGVFDHRHERPPPPSGAPQAAADAASLRQCTPRARALGALNTMLKP